MPLAFEKHAGGSGDRFMARGQGYVIGLDAGNVAIQVLSSKVKTSQAVSLEFAGGRTPKAVPGEELPGKVNLIRGSDPRKWQLGLPTYGRVTYSGVYPGIDVAYYGNQQQLEFDLLVKPGADPEAIRLKVGGAGRLSIDGSGALAFGEAAGGLKISLPQIYQEVNGAKKSVPGHYEIVGWDEVAFRIDLWDHARPLVIDPTIVYSTFFGGGLSGSQGQAIGLDALGNILIAGSTDAADFPAVDAAQNHLKASQNAFVTKINSAGTALIYSTYFGGSDTDGVQALAVDSTGAAWVTGTTGYRDFPLLNAAQSTGGGVAAFVARLDASGVLQFSTFLGSGTYGYGIAVDGLNNGYVTGTNQERNYFPTTAGVVQPEPNGGYTFVTKYTSSGSVVYSTLLGGVETSGQGIAVDSLGDAYVTGASYDTTFTGMPSGGAQTTNKGNGDAFAAKLNPTATAIVYFTFLGGNGYDQGQAIAVDSTFNAYIAGSTTSAGLATTGAAQTGLKGGMNGYAAKLNPAGNQFTWITYVGGNHIDNLEGMALDGFGNLYLTGYTDSDAFPTVSPVEPAKPGNNISLFNSTNSGASWTGFDFNIPGAVVGVSINPAGTSAVVTTDSGIYRTVDGGMSWTQQSRVPLYRVSRSPAAPGTIYAYAYSYAASGVYQSTDDGVTWNFMGSSSVNGGGDIMADPLTANIVYFFDDQLSPYVFFSTNGGATWSPAGTGLPGQVLSMAATTDGALYAGTWGYGIYKSTNQGASWTAVNTGLPSSSYAQFAQSLTASGTTVYFAWGYIYETTNGGASWAATPTYVGTGSIAASPQNASVLYALTNSGTVQESADGGTTWSVPGTGIPSGYNFSLSSALAVNPSNSAHVLVVASVSPGGFVAKLNNTGSALTWSTYLGGTDSTWAYAVATDGVGDAFVTGTTYDNGFPITSTALPSGGVFITEISDATAACSTLTVNPSSALAAPSFGPGALLTFDVVAPSGCVWSAMSNESWATVTAGASGTGTGIVTVEITSSASGAARTATLTVGSQNVTITQPGSSCIYTLDQSSYPVAAAGGTVSAVLTATAGCPWTVVNNDSSAIAFTSASSGTGRATVNLTVNPNFNAVSRNFSLPVGTTSIQIAQAGAMQKQTIAFGVLSAQLFGTAPFALSATASSGLPVSFASNTPSVCTVSGSTVTIVAAGTCTIQATQAGNATYGAATPVTQSFTVNPELQAISFGDLPSVTLPASAFSLSATATSGLSVSFASGTPSVCTVSGTLVTILGAGACSITASQTGNSGFGAASPVTRSFNVIASGTPTLTPAATASATGSGLTRTFTFTFSDTAGWQSLGVVDVLINNFLDGRHACYIAYGFSSLYLVDDAGDGGYAGAPIPLNGTTNISNSQCTINGAGSSAVGNGNTLTLTLNITFTSAFAGNKVVYLAARDTGTDNSGWVPAAAWSVPGTTTTGPAAGGVSPAYSSSANQTYTFTFTDTNGWQDITVANILINNAIDGRGACYIAFAPSGAGAGVVYLVDDAGDGGGPFTGLVLPGSGTAQNSQCTINGTGSSVSASGNTLTLTLAMSFSPSFAGDQVFYLAARNNTVSSDWQAAGATNVP